MSHVRACLLVLCSLPVLSVTALAQNQSQNQNRNQSQTQAQRPVVQQRATASQQATYANRGTSQANHVFDGRRAPSNPVRANTAPKQSPVGQPVRSTANNPGYKPASPRLHTNAVPSPTVSRSNTASTTVARSTTTATVARSTTTATTTAKKP